MYTNPISQRRPGRRAAAALAAVLILMMAAPTCLAQELGTGIDGQAFVGGQGQVLRFFGSPDEPSCRAACERAGAACQAYTWVKPNGYQPGDPPMCYLMSTYGTPSSHTCCITAVRARAAGVPVTEGGCCEWTMPDGKPNCVPLGPGATCQGTFVPRSPGCNNITLRCAR